MPDKISFLHIGKTGGTAVRTPIRQHLAEHPEVRIDLPGHKIGLAEIAAADDGTKVMFFIREPVSRFISGFNSRLRQGWPRHKSQWSGKEEKAFKLFKTPVSLAEALGSFNPLTRYRALRAIQSIRHTRMAYVHYLGSVELLEKEKDRIVFIGEQETLAEDYDLMKKVLGMDPALELPQDDVAAHRTPEGYDTSMSNRGRRNLERFYRSDYPIYEWCKRHREKLNAVYREQFGKESSP